jgi:xanthine dehydrogenase accessory factor
MRIFRRLVEMIVADGRAALVTVHAVEGSAPREAGARMAVRRDGAFHGTIGGGELEWRFLAEAREALAAGRGPARFLTQALGPDLGQCCGGRVTLLVETFDARDAPELAALATAEAQGVKEAECRLVEGRVRRSVVSPLPDGRGAGGEGAMPEEAPDARQALSPLAGESWRGGSGADRIERAPSLSPRRRPPSVPSPARGEGREAPGDEMSAAARPDGRGDAVWREPIADPLTPLLLFGAGHVGRALVLALAPLPFAVRWVDERADAFPAHIPASATPVRTADMEGEVGHAPQNAFVLVMTHSHPLDLALTGAALRRGFPFVGLIGSPTKRARFEARFRALGLTEARIRTLACPIGLPGIEGKEPAIIAAATVAQLLQVRENGEARLAPPDLRNRA